MEEKDDSDWLFPNAKTDKAKTEHLALRIAQNYLVFDQNPLAKAVLKQWTDLVRNRRIAVDASHAEYAAHNAIREFVEGIYQQIDFAHNRGNLPQ